MGILGLSLTYHRYEVRLTFEVSCTLSMNTYNDDILSRLFVLDYFVGTNTMNLLTIICDYGANRVGVPLTNCDSLLVQ